MKNRTLPLKPRILFLFTLLCAAVISVSSAYAATITVTSTADSGMGSLRQALADANDGDTINFDAAVSGTITLTSGELLVNDSITISGPDADLLAVNGNAASRVFHISSGKTVTISGLTITNGSASGGTYPNNSGGGIFNDHAALTVNNCALSGNSTSNKGGGILNWGALSGNATLTINDSTLSGASSVYAGTPSRFSVPLTIAQTILKTGAGAHTYNAASAVNSIGYNLS